MKSFSALQPSRLLLGIVENKGLLFARKARSGSAIDDHFTLIASKHYLKSGL